MQLHLFNFYVFEFSGTKKNCDKLLFYCSLLLFESADSTPQMFTIFEHSVVSKILKRGPMHSTNSDTRGTTSHTDFDYYIFSVF